MTSSPLALLALLAVALCSCCLPASAHPAPAAPTAAAADPLTVHLVCHSHDDVGWQITVDEYFDREVRSIITSVVQSLARNADRKFMYVEQAFFQRWWREQNDTQRALAQRLVAAKQLEFVNGGWCMHDEASTHYVDMVDQTTLGHRYISQQFGVQPTTTWQIDPFGHSATQAALFGPLAGFDAVFFERIDYQDKQRRAAAKELEMVWRASPSLGEKAQVFAGAFAAGYGYQPPSGFCWDRGCRNEPIQNNKSAPGYNLDTFVERFVATARRQANVTNGGNLMWTLGDDFEYQDAESWYVNLDKLIAGVNADGRVKTLYSTPSIYVAAKNAEGLQWPLKTDDFFPYADGSDSFWTGYFTSRSALKRYVRDTSAFLQVVRQVEWVTNANGSASQTLWEAQGVAQHHDAVSGTAKQAVTYDYAQRLSVGYDIGAAFLAGAMADIVTAQGGERPAFTTCPLLNVSVCAASQANQSLVVLLYNPSVHALTQRVTVPVPYKAQASVLDPAGAAVPSQTFPTMANIARGADSAAYEVSFIATLPPLGFTTYFVIPPTEQPATPPPSPLSAAFEKLVAPRAAHSSPLERLSRAAQEPVAAPAPAQSGIGNDYWTLTVDDATGLLQSATDRTTNTTYRISQNFYYYSAYQGRGQDSGAYIFRPDQSNATATPVTTQKVAGQAYVGPVTVELRQVFAPWLTQVVRLTQGSPAIEFEWTVGHIPVDDGQGKEIISRFSSDIASASTFYTDSNGREFVQRVRNYRPTWNLTTTEYTSSNYYPVNAATWLADSARGMAVVVDRTQGGTSLVDGELELMVHRRLLKDDGRGVGEPLNEPGVDGLGLTVTGVHYLLLSPAASLAAQARAVQAAVFAPALPLVAPLTQSYAAYAKSHLVNASASLDPAGLPANVDLMTVQVSEVSADTGATVVLLRLAHRFGVGEDAALSQPAQVDLATLFRVVPSAVVELSLTANQPLGNHKTYQWKVKGEAAAEAAAEAGAMGAAAVRRKGAGSSYPVTVGPAEIRTFNVTFQLGADAVMPQALFGL